MGIETEVIRWRMKLIIFKARGKRATYRPSAMPFHPVSARPLPPQDTHLRRLVDRDTKAGARRDTAPDLRN